MNQPPNPPPGQPPSWGPPPPGQPPFGPPGYASYTPPPPTSALAIVALVMTFVCMPVGLVLAIIALVRISNAQGALGGKTLAIIALAMNLMIVPVTGILAAIAIPNFVKFQCRSKQSEAKTNLKAFYVAEESFRAEFNKYSTSPQEVGWAPRGTKIRYAYEVLSATDEAFVVEARGLGEMEGDVWRINEQNQLEHVQDGCR